MRFPLGTSVGPYQVVAFVGAGGMGEVYRARDPRLGRDVAVKTIGSGVALEPERLRRFEQEVRAAGTLNHPNVVTVYDVGEADGTPYLVSEFLEGKSLRERIEGSGFTPRQAIDCAAQIARGLEAAHERGIVHRDLKPENVVLTSEGRAKILDFGIAKLVRDGTNGAAPGMTRTRATEGTEAGALLGTTRYMAPEQLRGEGVDARTDLFALGAMLFELITGKHPFARETPTETAAAILTQETPPIPEDVASQIPGLSRLVRKCLEKRPADRFHCAADLAFFLEHLIEDTRSGAAAASEEAAIHSLRRLTFRRGIVSSARFASDGNSVVYAAAWEGGAKELFWVHTSNPDSRPLRLEKVEVQAISATGEMALVLNRRYYGGYMYDGTLARLPMAGGTPRPLLDSVAAADWAPDGRTLAIVRHKGGKAILEYPAGTVLHETLGWIGSPRVSPDGGRVAFVDHDFRSDDAGRICIAERGKETRVLSADFASAQGLAWGRDGKSVWCTAAPMGANRSLLRISMDGSARTILRVPGSLTLQDVSPRGDVLVVHGHERAGIIAKAPGEDRERDLSWYDWSLMRSITADGSTVLFDESGEGGGQHRLVCIRGTDGSPAIAIGEGGAMDITPDGAWVLGVNIADPHSITLIPTGIGEPRTISLGDLAFHGGAWFPDGSRLAIVVAAPQGGMRMYLVDAATGERSPLSDAEVGSGQPVVSRDGNWIAMSGTDQIVRLYPTSGGEPMAVPGIARGERAVGWTPDDAHLHVLQPGPPPVTVYRLDVKSGEREPHLVAQPPDPTGIEGVMGVRLASSTDAYAYTYVAILTELYLLEGAA